MAADRPIDHLVLPVHDLDAAREAYARLGFTLTPKARHPFGTANSLVQLEADFLELLAVPDPAAIAPAGPDGFSFADFNKRFLARREGMSMLVFASRDARADEAEFRASGLATYPVFDFERRARLPDGSEAVVGFSLAFVTDPRLAEAAFFTCQQHAPQYFWKPEYQRHANTALAVAEVVMVAPEPARLADLLAKLQPGNPVAAEADSLSVATSRGRLTMLSPAGFADAFPGMAPPGGAAPHFDAFRLRVADLGAAASVLERNRVPHRRIGGELQIAPADNRGVALAFAA